MNNIQTPPNYNVAGKYASVELNLGDRSDADVWQFLINYSCNKADKMDVFLTTSYILELYSNYN
jgi:hypothetical protein